MRSNLTVWLALLALALGSASVAWVRTDTMGNGWMGILLQNGRELRIQFVDQDGSRSFTPRDTVVGTELLAEYN